MPDPYDLVVGAHLLGPGAGDLVNVFALAKRALRDGLGVPHARLRRFVHGLALRPPQRVEDGARAPRPGAGVGQRAQLEACVAACDACADECSKHADMHDHCRVCMECCRECSKACQALLDAMA